MLLAGYEPKTDIASFSEVVLVSYGIGLRATTFIPKGKVFFSFAGAKIISSPTYQSIQIGPGQHAVESQILSKLNHSCEPTVELDVSRKVCIAAKDIQLGDQLTFFYPSTEWIMKQSFRCHCRSLQCIGMVQGAYCLDLEVLKKHRLAPHILEISHGK